MRRVSLATWTVETDLWGQGLAAVAGVDEVGRGALAGPVVAAAVVLSPGIQLEGVDDSKRLRPMERERLFQRISQLAGGIGVGIVGSALIEQVNIRQGTLLAMREAVQQLPEVPDYLLVDGCDRVPVSLAQRAIIGGDHLIISIAAASIVAKVTRDRLMVAYDRQFPGYGFAQHKGYGTFAHFQALNRLGPCAIHRRTFRGVNPHG